jgi:hypothetical protein
MGKVAAAWSLANTFCSTEAGMALILPTQQQQTISILQDLLELVEELADRAGVREKMQERIAKVRSRIHTLIEGVR